MVMLPTSSYFLDGFGIVSLARSQQLEACPIASVTYNSKEGMSLLVKVFHNLLPAEMCRFV